MSSLQQSTNAFDALPIRQAVFRQTFPAIASQMITLIYNLADTYMTSSTEWVSGKVRQRPSP